ncbi:type II secretion system F family protein [Candidatus Micrarchaeota archaeon]|nr:type II secretion system F family protein [Candidatus Micrarchaeota archaeon]
MNLFLFRYGGILNGKLRRFVGLGSKIGNMIPGLKFDLQEAGYVASVGEYTAAALANSFFYSLTLFLILSFALLIRATSSNAFPVDVSNESIVSLFLTLKLAFASAFAFFFMFFFFFLFYPKVEARKIAENVDRDLIYALKDMQLQISSGVSLYDALANVSKSDYGRVSREFEIAVKDISAGGAEDKALEKIAERTESEFMRKTIWQMLTSLRAGTPVDGALKNTIASLNNHQRQQIKEFSSELNVLSLLYMLFAVAIPGLGSTLLIVLSSFGGIKVNELFYVAIISSCFFVEAIIIGFIRSRRPAVHA